MILVSRTTALVMTAMVSEICVDNRAAPSNPKRRKSRLHCQAGIHRHRSPWVMTRRFFYDVGLEKIHNTYQSPPCWWFHKPTATEFAESEIPLETLLTAEILTYSSPWPSFKGCFSCGTLTRRDSTSAPHLARLSGDEASTTWVVTLGRYLTVHKLISCKVIH